MFIHLPWVWDIEESGKDELWVATHNGKFHKDDVLSVAIVKLALPDHKINVVRTRDEDIINAADIVLDVGGVCDPEKFRFDHHDGAMMRVELSQYMKKRITGDNTMLLEFLCEDYKYMDYYCKASTVLQLLGYRFHEYESNPVIVELLKVSLTDQYGPKEFLRGPFDVIDILAGNDYSDASFNKMVDVAIDIISAMIKSANERDIKSALIVDLVEDNFDKRNPILVLDSWGPWHGCIKFHPWVLAVLHPVDNGGWMLHLPNSVLSDYMVMEDLDEGLINISNWMTIWSSKERALEVANTLLYRFNKSVPNMLDRLFAEDRWSQIPDDDEWYY